MPKIDKESGFVDMFDFCLSLGGSGTVYMQFFSEFAGKFVDPKVVFHSVEQTCKIIKNMSPSLPRTSE